jgi:leader peptidase (prepilin peptidase)/N-methyltransferase
MSQDIHEGSREAIHPDTIRRSRSIPGLFLQLPWYVWFPAIFVIGATVGSFLNVCIYRLPLEKSPLWPLSSRCGRCLQPIRAIDNLPLLSYWLRRGRCRTCGETFSVRYFWIELGTALGFVGLFYLEAVLNVHEFSEGRLTAPRMQTACLAAFLFHAVLLSFLIVAAFCDIDHRLIPLPLTVTGTMVGLIGAMLLPWPWPYTPAQATPSGSFIDNWHVSKIGKPFQGVYSWPVWGPLPPGLAPGGNWQTGLATGFAGFLAGTLLLRIVRFLFGLGRGKEYMDDPHPEAKAWGPLWRGWDWVGRVGGKALGLGDADLMMMAGAFLGWQPTLAAFFLSVVPGLVFGMVQIFLRSEQQLPFGPALAIGVLLAALGWHEIAPQVQVFFFNGPFIAALAGIACTLLLIAGYVLRTMKGWGGSTGPENS